MQSGAKIRHTVVIAPALSLQGSWQESALMSIIYMLLPGSVGGGARTLRVQDSAQGAAAGRAAQLRLARLQVPSFVRASDICVIVRIPRWRCERSLGPR